MFRYTSILYTLGGTDEGVSIEGIDIGVLDDLTLLIEKVFGSEIMMVRLMECLLELVLVV